MKQRHRARLFGSIAMLLAGLSLLVAACGGGGSKSSSTASASASTTSGSSQSSSSSSSSSASGKSFPLFRVTWDAPDYFDPALAYTVAGWQVMWNVYEGLLGYKHAAGAAGATLVPYLAQSMPQVANNGKTYTFTLRKGLQYSNGTPIKASDFQYTIERDFKVDSPGVGFFGNIQGVGGDTGFAATKKGHISGITTNDQSGKITIKLSQPEADFLNILATQFAAFVPKGTPMSDQSTKGIPSTGPYMIQSYSPNRSFTLVRNPHFDESKTPNIPKGNPDKVQGKIITDPVAALQTVLGGNSDYDFQPIPNDRLAEVQNKYGDRLKIYSGANMYYFFLNTRTPPFDNLQARKAVEYAVNRNAMVQFFGGLAQPTQNLLPPNYPQYQKINAYSYDLSKAKQLVKQSGTSGQTITVYGVNTDPSKSVVEYLASQLNKIGWNAKVKLLSHGVYFTTIGNQATKAQTGWADWYQDYPNPIDWFDVLWNGNRITQTHNNNYGNSNFKDVNSLIEKLKLTPSTTPSQNSQWAKVDHDLVVKYAAAVPYINRSGTDFFSNKIDLSCYINHVLYQFDFATICAK